MATAIRRTNPQTSNNNDNNNKYMYDSPYFLSRISWYGYQLEIDVVLKDFIKKMM